MCMLIRNQTKKMYTAWTTSLFWTFNERFKVKKNIQNTCINVNVKISFFRERGGHRNVDPKSKALFMKYIASVQFLTVFDVIVNIYSWL